MISQEMQFGPDWVQNQLSLDQDLARSLTLLHLQVEGHTLGKDGMG